MSMAVPSLRRPCSTRRVAPAASPAAAPDATERCTALAAASHPSGSSAPAVGRTATTSWASAWAMRLNTVALAR